MLFLWDILKWVWKWYPQLWRLLIHDDPFRRRSVSYWRYTWMVATAAAGIFGWLYGPLFYNPVLEQSGLLERTPRAEVILFGVITLVLTWCLIRLYPLDPSEPMWRQFMCAAICILLPYLVPWCGYRFNNFVNDNWNKSIARYILAPDPALNGEGFLNLAPYCFFLACVGALLTFNKFLYLRHRR